jgi:hypothetical protein
MPNSSTKPTFCKLLDQIFKILCLTAIVGDITPSDGIPKAEKSRREQAALDEICEVLGGGPIGGCTFFYVKTSNTKRLTIYL